MMSLRLLVFSGLTLGALGGCTDDDAGAVDYQRSGGFVGNRLSLHVDPGGKATRMAPDGKTVIDQLDATTMADLQSKIDGAQFPTLDPVYSCNCADDFLHEITVHVGGAEYTVKVDDTATFPARLQPLIDDLELLAGVVVIASNPQP